jgi:hypothetical protein
MGNPECQSFYYGDSRLFVVVIKGDICDDSDAAKAMKTIGKSVVYSRGNKVRLIIDFSKVSIITLVGVKGFSRDFGAFARKFSQAEAFAYVGETMKASLLLIKRLCRRDVDIQPTLDKCMAAMHSKIADTAMEEKR